MGESRRRSQLDPTFGKVRHYQGRKLLPDFGEYLAAISFSQLPSLKARACEEPEADWFEQD